MFAVSVSVPAPCFVTEPVPLMTPPNVAVFPLVTSTVLENARLLQEEQAKQQMEEELRVARTIQQSLLPGKLPADGWLHASGSSVAATYSRPGCCPRSITYPFSSSAVSTSTVMWLL